MEVENLRGAVFGLQQGLSDIQAGLAAMMGELRSMAAAVTGLQQASASTALATPVMQNTCKLSPGPLAIQSGLITPRASSKREAEQSPDHPGAEFLAQEIEDSEDELIAGAGKDARQQQQQQQQG